MKYKNKICFVLLVILTNVALLFAQPSPTRVGTTAGNFLELGYDPQGIAIGDAGVSTADYLSAIYWNPAGLSAMTKNEAFFAYQPWLTDTYTYTAAVGFVVPSIGNFAVSILGINYGKMEVTTMELQEGTGENFTPADLAFNISFGRNLTTWFGFGATLKYIRSEIYHSSANAVAADLGITIKTSFLSPTDERDGFKIGMSLSNYGTRLRYSGLDMLRSIDIAPNEAGNYKDVKVEYQTDSWELPLIFRIGASINPIVKTNQRLTLAMDALHVNNNNESVNLGAIYSISMPGLATLFLRGGYRGLFLKESSFGPTFGIGILANFIDNNAIQFDYAYRDIGILGYANVMGMSFKF